MKNLIVINGPMGVGKTSTCKVLNRRLDNSVWLDGDWCWMMDPFILNDENKSMVIDNISYILNNYLKNSNFKNIIFNWVIHDESILNNILSKIEVKEYKLSQITLICSKDILKKRISNDIIMGKRDVENLEKSLSYLKFYEKMDIDKIDTSNLGKEETVDYIIKMIR